MFAVSRMPMTMIRFLIVSIVLAAAPPVSAQPLPKPSNSGGNTFGPPSAAAAYPVTVKAQFTTPTAEKQARLFITATIEPEWHVNSITQAPGGPLPTKIEISTPPGVRVVDEFRSSVLPKTVKDPDAYGDLPLETHQGTVTWYAPINLAADIDPARLRIDGKLTIQACNDSSKFCLPPTPIAFAAALGPGIAVPQAAQASGPPPAAPASSWPAAAPVFDPSALKIAENDQIKQTSMGLAIAMGFLGGLILNIMPCVLPVIGLKLLSFLEQSGHNRWHAFALNVWYSLGLLSVFLVLATLAVTLGFGWGQLFGFSGFNIALAAVVFAMGLSFLGVWEVPIPGFVGRGKTAELAEQEGFAGAFSKGVLTTILATPCSARFWPPR